MRKKCLRLPAPSDRLEPHTRRRVCVRDDHSNQEEIMLRGALLWLLGVPIPVIIILWLLFR